MNKKGQIAIGSGAIVVIVIIILLLLPIIKVNYISFSISQDRISEPSYDMVKKSILSNVLESIGTSSKGAYDVELFVYNLSSCPNYENYRSESYRNSCQILFQKKFNSITAGTYYEEINYEIPSDVEIYLRLKRAGENYAINENYARIQNG